MIEAAVAKATAPLLERIAALEAELAKAKKNSSNSSKPPSSDIVKPPKPPRKGGKKRKRGGQPGHEQHLRSPFPPEAVNEFLPYTLDCCPDCGGTLVPSRRPPEVLQQVEIIGHADHRHGTSRLGLLVPALPQDPLRPVARGDRQGGLSARD